jgi:glutathione synthase/RimK-type ligase-like ATP-grasp enzyme
VIAFFGYGTDRSLGRAVAEARARGAAHFLVDQEGLDFVEVCVESDSRGVSGFVAFNAAEHPLRNVKAAYARPLAPPIGNTGEENLHGTAVRDALVEWLDVADCLVVNRPSAMHSNASKPYQVAWLARFGFEIPDTLVTSNPEEALDFWQRHGTVIFKSTSGVRSIVKELDAEGARNLARLRLLPTQFQAAVPGVDVRVHVVGERVFATEIESTAVDYRYARRDQLEARLSAISLPSDVAERCVAVSRELGLPLCGIDLRRRPDGGHVCFEVNPMPGYSYYESETGQPISEALVDLLLGN